VAIKEMSSSFWFFDIHDYRQSRPHHLNDEWACNVSSAALSTPNNQTGRDTHDGIGN
jgi:hypothetical protein